MLWLTLPSYLISAKLMKGLGRSFILSKCWCSFLHLFCTSALMSQACLSVNRVLPAGDPLWVSSSESAKTSASSWSDMSVSSVRSMRSKWTSREDTLLKGSASEGGRADRDQLMSTKLNIFSVSHLVAPQFSLGRISVWWAARPLQPFPTAAAHSLALLLQLCWICICFINFDSYCWHSWG